MSITIPSPRMSFAAACAMNRLAREGITLLTNARGADNLRAREELLALIERCNQTFRPWILSNLDSGIFTRRLHYVPNTNSPWGNPANDMALNA